MHSSLIPDNFHEATKNLKKNSYFSGFKAKEIRNLLSQKYLTLFIGNIVAEKHVEFFFKPFNWFKFVFVDKCVKGKSYGFVTIDLEELIKNGKGTPYGKVERLCTSISSIQIILGDLKEEEKSDWYCLSVSVAKSQTRICEKRESCEKPKGQKNLADGNANAVEGKIQQSGLKDIISSLDVKIKELNSKVDSLLGELREAKSEVSFLKGENERVNHELLEIKKEYQLQCEMPRVATAKVMETEVVETATSTTPRVSRGVQTDAKCSLENKQSSRSPSPAPSSVCSGASTAEYRKARSSRSSSPSSTSAEEEFVSGEKCLSTVQDGVPPRSSTRGRRSWTWRTSRSCSPRGRPSQRGLFLPPPWQNGGGVTYCTWVAPAYGQAVCMPQPHCVFSCDYVRSVRRVQP